MRLLFIDTHYFIAIFHIADEWHKKAVELESTITDCRFVTTDFVLVEILNHFSHYGVESREQTVRLIEDVLEDSQIKVVESAREIFLEGMRLYASRLDKGYSLTDCISMNTCRQFGISEILTHDHHFKQEGFEILL